MLHYLLTHKNDNVKDSVMKGERDDDPVVVKVEKMQIVQDSLLHNGF